MTYSNYKALRELKFIGLKMLAFVYSFIYKYLLSAYDVPCTVQNAEDASQIH